MSSDLGPDASGAAIPAELVGEWTQGSVPITTNPLDWTATSGSAFLNRFAEDGTYEFAGSMTGAGMTVSSWEHGAFTVTGDRLTLRPTEERVRQPDGSTTTSQPGPRSYRWQVGVDAIGSVTLALTLPDGQQDQFYRR